VLTADFDHVHYNSHRDPGRDNDAAIVVIICRTHLSIVTILQTNKLSQRRIISLCTFLIVRHSSVVRFRLPLTPPQGTDLPPKSVRYREVGTMDSAIDKPKLNKSASKWTKTDLTKLGVDYKYDRFDKIEVGNRGDVPTELVQGNHPSVYMMLICSHRVLCSKNRVCGYASHQRI
jgi:hypothetical protein